MANPIVKLLKRFPNWSWNYSNLSSNPAVSQDFVESHPDIPWHDFGLLLNSSMSLSFIENFRTNDELKYYTRIHIDSNKTYSNPNNHLLAYVSMNSGVIDGFLLNSLISNPSPFLCMYRGFLLNSLIFQS